MLCCGGFREMLTDDGPLLLGSIVLADPELAEHPRFVPGDYLGDPTWWWVPGRLAMRWMLDAAGGSGKRDSTPNSP